MDEHLTAWTLTDGDFDTMKDALEVAATAYRNNAAEFARQGEERVAKLFRVREHQARYLAQVIAERGARPGPSPTIVHRIASLLSFGGTGI